MYNETIEPYYLSFNDSEYLRRGCYTPIQIGKCNLIPWLESRAKRDTGGETVNITWKFTAQRNDFLEKYWSMHDSANINIG